MNLYRVSPLNTRKQKLVVVKGLFAPYVKVADVKENWLDGYSAVVNGTQYTALTLDGLERKINQGESQ